jgi:trimethylamine:corrinoid methyltransferase-like protein
MSDVFGTNCGAPRLIDVDRRRRAGRNGQFTQEMAMANIGEPMRRL